MRERESSIFRKTRTNTNTTSNTIEAFARSRKTMTISLSLSFSNMGFAAFPILFSLLLTLSAADELASLLDLKASLDPENLHLGSWVAGGDPCGGAFEGVACNERRQVANISLQGKGLAGKLSPAVGRLQYLTGLYLHYNSLHGEIPVEIANLAELNDLYLNVNNLSGEIPPELGNMQNLQGFWQLIALFYSYGCFFTFWLFFLFLFLLLCNIYSIYFCLKKIIFFWKFL